MQVLGRSQLTWDPRVMEPRLGPPHCGCEAAPGPGPGGRGGGGEPPMSQLLGVLGEQRSKRYLTIEGAIDVLGRRLPTRPHLPG